MTEPLSEQLSEFTKPLSRRPNERIVHVLLDLRTLLFRQNLIGLSQVALLENCQTELQKISNILPAMASDLQRLREALTEMIPSDTTRITVNQIDPLASHHQKESPMNCKVRVKKVGSLTAHAKLQGHAQSGVFTLLDGGQGTFEVLGTNQSGQDVDISSVAALTVAADPNNPAVTVDAIDPASPMKFVAHAPSTGDGSADLTVTATWLDASIGPFNFVATIKYSGGAIIDIVVKQVS